MDTLYRFIVFLHVGSAVFSIGPFIILIPIVKKLRAADVNVQQAYIDIIRFSVRLVKHAGHVLVGSGVLLIAMGPWTWKTPWIIATLIVMFGSIFFLARAYTPTLRVFFEPKQNQHALVKKLSWSSWLYLILLMIMLWFMVAKPALW
ncbi:hypothetical protein ACFFHH_04765 [Cytobacillus solani]|uniref:hypothetical protein n=1 Tax=Cytobacillus solani TaxID=1637975 RepID=UPI0006ABE34C|nr:hypothetical protein [Cytobacillus solani]KOP71216.1 hypothetical protein AMS60_24560 [Bacillus sp. FJAT-21945]USK55657.1 hypothetical protein LIS82_03745 [Cytobacillus solani]